MESIIITLNNNELNYDERQELNNSMSRVYIKILLSILKGEFNEDTFEMEIKKTKYSFTPKKLEDGGKITALFKIHFAPAQDVDKLLLNKLYYTLEKY